MRRHLDPETRGAALEQLVDAAAMQARQQLRSAHIPAAQPQPTMYHPG